MKRRPAAPTRLLRRRARERHFTAISVNRGGGVIETVFIVRERHAPHIARLVADRRARKDGTR